MGNKCGRRGCRGLRDSPEFDIWIETEENCFAPAAKREIDEYGQGEVELRKAIPGNGKAVLIFRLRCGCPVGKLEFAGEQRGRRTRK
ncbi:hypothetical protein M569_14695 [Genlisea aurea]|uniref:Ribosomal protein L34e superfamily protein n=1 Tax=Genlisea aurea TaxID=192259 RepID=S8BZS8_9LAMI|nr:hypothetical protein M569_14695 [Genlisea aurea]